MVKRNGPVVLSNRLRGEVNLGLIDGGSRWWCHLTSCFGKRELSLPNAWKSLLSAVFCDVFFSPYIGCLRCACSRSFRVATEVHMDWILDCLDPDSGCFQQDQEWGFLSCSRIRIGFGFCVYWKKTLLFVWFTYIYPDSNRSRIAWMVVGTGSGWIRIQNLQNRIGSGLKKIRVRTPLLATIMAYLKINLVRR